MMSSQSGAGTAGFDSQPAQTRNPEGHHLGDLPNVEVFSTGKGESRVLVGGASLAGGPNSLFGPQGTALVVHEKPDDEMTDPAGNAGPRIACGVIGRSSG